MMIDDDGSYSNNDDDVNYSSYSSGDNVWLKMIAWW